jgi:hypothetical protein
MSSTCDFKEYQQEKAIWVEEEHDDEPTRTQTKQLKCQDSQESNSPSWRKIH